MAQHTPTPTLDETLLSEIRCGSNGYVHQKRLILKSGASSPKHYHKKTTETYSVISGDGEILFRDQCIKVSPGDYLIIPTNAIHQIRNTSKTNLVIISTKNQRVSFEDFHEVP
jgi:mannose-6-phosphate isomerase-like protein (cupin superfamily)